MSRTVRILIGVLIGLIVIGLCIIGILFVMRLLGGDEATPTAIAPVSPEVTTAPGATSTPGEAVDVEPESHGGLRPHQGGVSDRPRLLRREGGYLTISARGLKGSCSGDTGIRPWEGDRTSGGYGPGSVRVR